MSKKFIMVLILRKYSAIACPLQRSKKHFVIQCCSKRQSNNQVPCSRPKDFLSRFIDNIVSWYDELIGMDEVRKAQSRVLQEEINFKNAQETRKKLFLQLNDINRKIKEVYIELDSTDRGEEKYVNLVTLEHKLLKEEKAIAEQFALAESNERESFAVLSNSVKLSHEQERAQRERTKYWSLFGSIIGTLLGVLGTSINNHFKMAELKKLVKDSSEVVISNKLNTIKEDNEKFFDIFKKTQNEVNALLSLNIDTYHKKMDNVFSKINFSLNNIENRVNAFKVVKIENDDYGVLMEKLSNSSEVEIITKNIDNQFKHSNLILYVLVFISIVMPIITRSS